MLQRLLALVAVVIVMTGCSASGKLASNSAPSPVVMGTAEGCLESAEKVFAKSDPKTSADKAAVYCKENRHMEVARDTATANAAARAAIAENRVYDPYNGRDYYGPGIYGDEYLWGNPRTGGLRSYFDRMSTGANLRLGRQRCTDTDPRYCR